MNSLHLECLDPLNVVCCLSQAGKDVFLHRFMIQMFQFPCLVTMSIAASRMYRSLADFVSSDLCVFRSFVLFCARCMVIIPIAHAKLPRILAVQSQTLRVLQLHSLRSPLSRLLHTRLTSILCHGYITPAHILRSFGQAAHIEHRQQPRR